MSTIIDARDDAAGRTVMVTADDGLIRLDVGARPYEIEWTWVTPAEARAIAAALVEAATEVSEP
ncbi:MAG: hypothetical protein QOE86_743 [Solirubrobacteraceae bacterium]|nr:hypothetical protein [Solirubrobacteraceae bacterium]